jgi:hypothetical protein
MAAMLAPFQGDHVFGDVIGMVQTALQAIIGGGHVWPARFQSLNPVASLQWQVYRGFDLGHAGNEPLVHRNGGAETDQHAHVFGGYSLRFQWTFCEVVCTGFDHGHESRRIGGGVRAWRRKVMSRFDDVLDHLVDSTALNAYLGAPNAIRQANPGIETHPVISLQAARQLAQMNQGPGQARILEVCGNYHSARSNLEGMLMRFDGPTRTWDRLNNVWI